MKDKGYIEFRDKQFKLFAESLARHPDVRNPGQTTEKVGFRTYEIKYAVRGQRAGRVLVTIIGQRPVAFWFMGHFNGYQPFKKALARAKLE
jgi:hypothetical protein